MVYTAPSVEEILINGIDVTTYRFSGQVIKTRQPVKGGTFRFIRTITNIIPIDKTVIGKSFSYKRGFSTADRYILRGEVISFKQVGSVYEIEVNDKLYQAVRLESDYTFDKNTDIEAGVGSEIAKSLLTDAGLTYSDLSIPTTGTADNQVIKQFPAKGSIIDSLKSLANNYGRRIFYKDSDDLVYFYPDTYDNTSTVLQTGVNIINRVQWLVTGEDMINNLTVIGAVQADWNTETFTTTGVQQTFTLGAIPIDTQIYLDTTLLVRGVDSSDPKDYYVLPDQKKVVFTVNPSGSLEINYSYNVPAKVNNRDDESITTYQQRDKTVTSDKILTSDDGELLSQGLLDQSSDALTSAPLRVIGNNDLEISQIVQVIDSTNSVNDNFLVTQISYFSPYKPDEVTVGKRPVNQIDINIGILNNIAKLNRQTSTNSDVSVQLINQNKEVTVEGWMQISQATIGTDGDSATALYWDSDTQGTWDDWNWGDDSGEIWTEIEKVYINGVVTL